MNQVRGIWGISDEEWREVFEGEKQIELGLSTRGKREKIEGLWTRGPVPNVWIDAAAALGVSALHVGMHLWHLAGRKKRKGNLPVSNVALKIRGIDADKKRRALVKLERAGLISRRQVEHNAVEVTLLCTKGEVPTPK